MDKAISYSEALASHPWIKTRQRDAELQALTQHLKNLKAHINELTETRIDPTRQYPSLGLANRTLRPSRRNITNALAIIETELDEADTTSETHRAFMQTRYLWSQMLSNFRLYLARA